jgi:branched-chain amino acid transport system permease protein
MEFKHALRMSLYTAALAVILALTGIFSKFSTREVITGTLTLSFVVLTVLIGTAGWLSATSVSGAPSRRVLAGAMGGVIVAAFLGALLLIESFVDLSFVFPNVLTPMREGISFGQDLIVDVLLLLGLGALFGAIAALIRLLPNRLETALLGTGALTVIVGLLENQIKGIAALSDVLPVFIAFVIGYVISGVSGPKGSTRSVVAGLAGGAVVGVLTVLVLGALVIDSVNLRPVLFTAGAAIGTIIGLALVGATGALARRGNALFHDGMWYLMVFITSIGVLHWQNDMTPVATVLIAPLWFAALLLIPPRGLRAEQLMRGLSTRVRARQSTAQIAIVVVLLIALPLLTGQYITNVLNAAGLYILLGIGLNLVVGTAGLLDLGYVAFFAIGAYTVGILTTPNVLTCGGADALSITPETIGQVCTGITSFWVAWVAGLLMAAGMGIVLGVPVLRLRGDYLAIVTLGFGEIIRLIVRYDDFKSVFGAAQGIPNIPRPEIDLTMLNPAWRISFTGEVGIYYLILIAIVIAAVVASRLVQSRIGRSWRAMRADEDVAQMSGVNITRAKLLAFGIGASFAGLGGAISAVRLYGSYPDSFTILVSINVLCIIIIGGLGSAPGVILGALILVGMPEILRELADYRLLAFGALLVAAMLVRPQGLVPPKPARLSEQLREPTPAGGD